MKHGKRPTAEQRKFLKLKRLNTEDWLVSKDTPEVMILRHRYTDATREIRKD